MAYTFFIDKPELFECTIDVQGESVDTIQARLVIEGSSCNYMFEGTISDNVCKINLGKLQKILQEGQEGSVRLEVVADDMLAIPWTSTYNTKRSKKVVAEVKEPTTTNTQPKVSVTINKSADITSLSKEFVEVLKEHKITIYNVGKHRKTITNLFEQFSKKHNNINIDTDIFINEVLELLAKK